MAVPNRPRWALSSLAAVILATAAAPQSNVLVVVADDLGVDLVGAYGEHPQPAATPVIDGLAQDGLLFRNVWANPSCSPTRAALLTGRYAHRTGVGFAFDFNGSPFELSNAETTLAEALAPTHHTWAVGKWHLASALTSGYAHPLLQGFDRHLGPIANLAGGQVNDAYWDYEKSVDGVPFRSTTYATTEQVDDALALIGSASGPWFLWLAFSAPHTPIHAPPAHLHGYSLPANVADDLPLAARAMVEAMDTELGRLLAGIPPAELADTLVIFVGDNGSAALASTPPFDPGHAKGTVYDGGLRVPLIMSGPGVPAGAESSGLVNVTDLFATVTDFVGASVPAPDDSVSLVPYFSQPGQPTLRPWIFAERFAPNGPGPGTFVIRERAARQVRFKLIQRWEGPLGPVTSQLYDLWADPFETTDLLASPPLPPLAQLAYDDLQAALEQLDEHHPWDDLGQSLAGSDGVAPTLAGAGELLPGEPVSLLLVDATPDNVALLVLGFSTLNVPLKGGVLVPAPDALATLFTDAVGSVLLGTSWPPDAPSGVDMWWQAWAVDPLGPQGFTVSNGLHVQSM